MNANDVACFVFREVNHGSVLAQQGLAADLAAARRLKPGVRPHSGQQVIPSMLWIPRLKHTRYSGITQHVERSSQEQARGGRQITQTIEGIASMVSQLNSTQRAQSRSNDTVLTSVSRIDELARAQQRMVAHLQSLSQRLRQRVENLAS